MKLIIRKVYDTGTGIEDYPDPAPEEAPEPFFGIYLKRADDDIEHVADRDTLAEAQALVAELIEVGQNYSMGEAIADIAHMLALSEFQPGNSRDACMFSVDWALEFEKKWAGHDWGVVDLPDSEGGEYIDTIQRFFREKYAAWLAAEQAQPQSDLGHMTVRPQWAR